MTNVSSRWYVDLIVVSALIALAVVVRLAPWPVVYGEGDVVMRHVDAHYHLHLAREWAAGIPPRWVDPHIAWPEGSERVWPLGFTALLALPSVWGAGALVPAWAAAVPVGLGVVAQLLAMALALRIGGRLAAVGVGLFVALAGGAVDITSLGDVDHHAIIGPITLGALLALLSAIDAPDRRRAIAGGLVAGVLSASGTALWPISAPIFHAVLCAIVGVLLLGRERSPQLAPAAASFGLGGAVAAAAIAASCSTDLGAFVSFAPSWLFALPFLGAFAVVTAMAAMSRRAILIVACAGVLAAVGAAVAIVPLRLALVDLLSVAGGRSAMYNMAREADRLFAPRGVFSMSAAFRAYSPLVLLVPMVLVLAARNVARASRPETADVLVWVAGTAAFALALMQLRFREYSVYVLPLTLVWGFRALLHELPAERRRAMGGTLAAVAAMSLATMAVPVVRAAELSSEDTSQRDLSDWVDQIETTIGAAPAAPPNHHSVVAPWELANVFARRTELFVTTASFGAPRATAADARTARILLVTDGDERERLLDEAEARWVVVGGVPSVESLAALAGVEPPAFEVVERADGGWVRETFARPEFWQTLLGRLLLADGAMGPLGRDGVVADVGAWRLAWESPATVNAFGRDVPALRLFERVEGVPFAGQAAPGTEVIVTVDVETNQHRRFIWQGRAIAGDDGQFVIRVPYVEGCDGSITAGPPTRADSPRR